MIKIAVLILLSLTSFIEAREPKKCLFGKFVTNHTADGLENCVCPPHLEYDPNYGICFENKCKQVCGDMKCAIRKPNTINFDYLCYCDRNYVQVNPAYRQFGCTALENVNGIKEVAKNVPKNPLFLKHLRCSHTYKIVNGKYQCACFEGYLLQKDTNECILKKRCNKVCNANQICAVNDDDRSYCTCKVGFGGDNCKENFCEWKAKDTKEKAYLDISIQSVCGTNTCSFIKETNDFKCDCTHRLGAAGENGQCQILKPCLKTNEGYKKCTMEESQFCMIRLDRWNSFYQCMPSIEQRGKTEYEPRFNKTERIDFKIAMKMRLYWGEGNVHTLFLNQKNNLISPGIDKKVPPFLLNEFIEYEEEVFWDFEEAEFYKPQLEDKFRNQLHKGLKGFHLFRYYCGNYTIYPEFKYDDKNLKMNRLIETVFDVEYQIYCQDADRVRKNLTDSFHDILLKDFVENYYYLRETGFIYPDTIKITFGDQIPDEDGKAPKCLRQGQKAFDDDSPDGLANCKCINGMEWDPFFGVCFENKCKETCGDMSCSILKHSIDFFEFQCHCEKGFMRVDPYYPKGCRPITVHHQELTENKKIPHTLPIDPFIAQKLKCEHLYKFNDKTKDYECDCLKGYMMDSTNKCNKIKGLPAFDKPNNCTDNQIFKIDDKFGFTGSCVCKAGFGGINCEHHICNLKLPVDAIRETIYLQDTVRMHCGSPSCSLVFDEFRCHCTKPLKKNDNHECELEEICVKEKGYGNCSKDKFCRILSDDLKEGFECKCPLEQKEDDHGRCLDYIIPYDKYCLPGYVDNQDEKLPQKCIKGKSKFNLKLKLRFSYDLMNSSSTETLLADYYNLESSISLDKIPSNLIDEFISYKERSTNYSINTLMNKLIIKDQLQDILRYGFMKNNQESVCSTINPVSNIRFDEKDFNLFKLIETVVDVDLIVTCANQLAFEKYLQFFKQSFEYVHIDDMYYKLPGVGFVLSEGVKNM